MADDDFDFFDEPIASDTPKYPKINAAKEDKNSHTEQSDDSADYDKFSDKGPRGKSNSSPDRSPESERRRRDSYSSGSRTPRSNRDDHYSDSFSDDDDSVVKESPRSKGSIKIEARVPSVQSGSRHRHRSNSSESDYSSPRSREASPDSKNKGSDLSYNRPKSSNKYRKNRKDSESFSETESLSDADSDVTDVSPLNSPHLGSRQHERYKASGKPPKSPIYTSSNTNGDRISSSYHKSNGSSSAFSNLTDADSEKMNLNILMQAVMEMENNRQNPDYEKSERIAKNRRVLFVPQGAAAQNKKNFSFTNDTTTTIDRENQRLMQNIMKYTTNASKAKQMQKAKSKSVPARMTPSAVNRLREQQRIERENIAFLRRLQKTTACKEIKRDNLLGDYERKTIAGHSVAAAHPLHEQQSNMTMLNKKYYSTSHLDAEKASVVLKGHGKWSRPSSASTYQTNVAIEPATVTFQSKRTRPVSASTYHREGYDVSEKAVSGGRRRPQSAHVGGTTKLVGKYQLTSTRPDWDAGW